MSESTTDCPQCGSDVDWSSSSWCPDCGYYPAAGKVVQTPQIECEEEVYDHWWQAVPFWMWVQVGGVGVLFVISVAVRVIFEPGTVRLFWTIGQITIGLVTFGVAHFLAYLFGASRTDRMGPFDAFLKPVESWQPVLRAMPGSSKLVWSGTWGIFAIIFGFLIVGGIDIQALAEAHQQAVAEKPKKKRTSPMAFIMQSAQTIASVQGNQPSSNAEPESMEDALAGFVGAAGVGEDGGLLSSSTGGGGGVMEGMAGSVSQLTGEGGSDPKTSLDQQQVIAQGEMSGENPAGGVTVRSGQTKTWSGSRSNFEQGERIVCLVIGYTTNGKGETRSLLLAAPIDGQLRFVSKVSIDQVEPDTLQGITERFLSLRQGYPLIYSPYGGRWLKPELFCQVEFSGWSIGGRLSTPYVSQYADFTPPLKEAPPAQPGELPESASNTTP